MRTAGKMKAGFYPTPSEIVDLISSFIERPIMADSFRFLDPCCGEGEALGTLALRLGVKETYGVELDLKRAKEAGKILKQVLAGSYESLKCTWKCFSLLFLNPPYDYDEESKRLEYRFLVKLTPYLQAGGLLIYVIAQKHLNRDTARYLASHFENVQIRRFPDPEYEAYHQIVIFGARKESVYRDGHVERELERLAFLPKSDVPILERMAHPMYQLVTPAESFGFYLDDVNPELALEEIGAKGLLRKGTARDQLFPTETPAIKPLMPLRRGHLAMLLSAGYLNNTLLEYKGRKLLIKGKCVKEQVKTETEDEKGVTVSELDVIKTTIKGLFLDTGKLITIE